MFKFRNADVVEQSRLPSIHVYHCGKTALLNDVLIEYEMIRRAREAEKNLTQLLLLQETSGKGSLLEFRVIEDLLSSFNRTKRLADHVENLIPTIKITPCKEDTRTAADLEDEMIQRAQIARMLFEEAPETFDLSDDYDDMSSDDEYESSDSDGKNFDKQCLNYSTESLNSVQKKHKKSSKIRDRSLSRSEESLSAKRTFPFLTRPLQLLNLKKARSFSLKSKKDAESYAFKGERPKLVQFLSNSLR